MSAIKEPYRPIVGAAAKAAGAVGVPGAFSGGFDLVAVSGIWTGMTMAIAHESRHRIDKNYAMKIVAAIGAGGAAYYGGSKLFTSALHFVVPGAGSLAAVGINGVLNYWYTFRVGKGLSGLFDRPDFTALDFGDLVTSVLAVVSPFPGAGEMREAVDLAVNTPIVPPDTFRVFEQYRRA